MSARAIVEIEGLRLGFRRRGGIHHVFRGADLAIREGELTCLIGPSGSGKTVLVNLLIGSLRPGRGGPLVEGRRIAVLGTDVTRRYPRGLYDRLAVVFQESALFDDLSTFENVAFGLRRRGLARRTRRAEVERLLRAVELIDPPGRTDALSGGQKKRLALARALAKDPDLLLFDEPTTGLDPRLRRQIAALIQRTHAAGGGRRTTLVVTHDYEDFLPLADRVLRIDTARGLVEEVPEGADPEAQTPPGPEGAAPLLAPEPRASRLLRLPAAPVRGLLGWAAPFLRLAASPLPSSLRQVAARFLDAVVHPALYTASAGAVLGGLSTFFALENNPLKGALDRQAIIGLGKVIVAIVVPLMTAVLFAARVGAGAAARLGNIRLRRGDDALRVMGADPDAYLTAPVFWSFLAGLPLLAVPVGIAAALASLAFACFSRPITPFGWARAFFSEVTPGDLRFAVLKLAGSGVLVAAAAVYMGFKPKLGAEDLGRHVTGAIVAGTLLVILWHGLLTLVQYG